MLPEFQGPALDVPAGDTGHNITNVMQLEFNSEPLQLGLRCPNCKSNQIMIADLMKRGALRDKEYTIMQEERKIVHKLKEFIKQCAETHQYYDDTDSLLFDLNNLIKDEDP